MTPQRTVLFLTMAWPTEDRPAHGIFVRELANAAARDADVVAIYLDRQKGERGLYDIASSDDGVPLWQVRYRRFSKPLSVVAFVLGARRAIRATGRTFDVVQSHSFLSTLVSRVLLPKTPIVHTEQWSIFLPERRSEFTSVMRPTTRMLARLAFNQARILLAPSRAMQASLAAIAPRTPSRVVPNAVDLSLFSPSDVEQAAGLPQLISVGMMTANQSKGIDFLLRAARLLVDRAQPFLLHLVGGGPRREEYEALARELEITEHVRFHGVLSKPEIAELLRASDVFVLASRFDNNPCVVIEAMASGLPVVATRVGGVPEMVEPDTGILVEPRSPEAIATGIEEVLTRLSDFDSRQIATRAGERYGQERIAADLTAVYDAARAGH